MSISWFILYYCPFFNLMWTGNAGEVKANFFLQHFQNGQVNKMVILERSYFQN